MAGAVADSLIRFNDSRSNKLFLQYEKFALKQQQCQKMSILLNFALSLSPYFNPLLLSAAIDASIQ